MTDATLMFDMEKIGKKIWNGPIPSGSYYHLGNHVKMATAEYFFLRVANERKFQDAVRAGNELCGRYATRLTVSDCDDEYVILPKARTSTGKIRRYLSEIRGTDAGRRALRVLECVTDNACEPSQYAYDKNLAKKSCTTGNCVL